MIYQISTMSLSCVIRSWRCNMGLYLTLFDLSVTLLYLPLGNEVIILNS
jgi:hypothetical protein